MHLCAREPLTIVLIFYIPLFRECIWKILLVMMIDFFIVSTSFNITHSAGIPHTFHHAIAIEDTTVSPLAVRHYHFDSLENVMKYWSELEFLSLYLDDIEGESEVCVQYCN